MFKKIATWIHLASGGGVKPPAQRIWLFARRKAKQPAIIITLDREGNAHVNAKSIGSVEYTRHESDDALWEAVIKVKYGEADGE
jgi:hypothetical protein